MQDQKPITAGHGIKDAVLSVIKSCFIAVLLSIGITASVDAQGAGAFVLLSLDTTNKDAPLKLFFERNTRTDITTVRIRANAPTKFASFFNKDVNIYPINETTLEIRRCPGHPRCDTVMFPPGDNILIARLLTDSSTREQSFTVDLLNANGQVISRQTPRISIPSFTDLPGPCSQSFISLNTGVGTAIGGVDPYWTVKTPSSSAFLPVYAIQPHPAWFSLSPTLSQWISAYNTPFGQGGSAHDVYEYKREFCATDSSKATLTLTYESDDIATVYFNGSGPSGAILPQAGFFSPVTISYPINVQPGNNYLLIKVVNTGGGPTGLILKDASVTTQVGNLGLTSDKCCTNKGTIYGRKIWDLNCNGGIDNGEQGVQGWTITLTSPGGATQTTTTDANGKYSFLNLPPGTYTLSEVTQNGWSQSTSAGPYTVYVAPDAYVLYDFLNCKTPTCEQLFTKSEQEGECCATNLHISNAGGAGLQSLSYTVVGGVVDSISTTPCTALSTTPASINGSTSGTLTFNTACTMLNPMSLNIQTTATNATGNVCITWVGTFRQGNQTFTCSTQSCIQCRRMPKDCGNPLSVTSYSFAGTQTDWRTFTISNVKLPVSEISFVDIKFVNEPALHHNGGQLFAPSARSWTVANSGGAIDPYTQIRLGCDGAQATHGAASGSYVKFNLGVDSTLNYTGVVKIKIGYCDGDTCEVEYLWQPPRRIRYSNEIVRTRDLRALNPRIFELDITPPDSAASMSIALGDEEAKILAASVPPPFADSTKDSTDTCPAWLKVQSKGNVVSYTPSESEGLGLGVKPRDWPRFIGACTVRVVFSPDPKKIKDPTTPVTLPVTVSFYDSEGRLLGSVEKQAVAGISIDIPTDVPAGMIPPIGSGMTIDIQPNPATSSATLTLGLLHSEVVSIVVTDMQGKEVQRIINSQTIQAGSHVLALSTNELVNGSYIVTARTMDGRTTTSLLKVVK